MKVILKSPYHIVDAVFVGWSLIAYRQVGHSSMSFAIWWISFITALNVLFVIGAFDIYKAFAHQGYLIIATSMLVCGIALYFRYLRDQKYAHALVESYRSERKWAWYARIIAVGYFLSPLVLRGIFVLRNLGK